MENSSTVHSVLKTCSVISSPRIKGETLFRESSPELEEDFTIIRALRPSETYEFRVVSVDGLNFTESDTQEIDVNSSGKLFHCLISIIKLEWEFQHKLFTVAALIFKFIFNFTQLAIKNTIKVKIKST